MNYRDLGKYLESTSPSDLDERVLEAIHERRVVKLTCNDVSLWVFNGRERDYLIVPRMYCSCMDFELNVVIRGSKPFCYHLIAQRISELRNAFKDLKVDMSTLIDVLIELIYLSRSPTLRRIISGH